MAEQGFSRRALLGASAAGAGAAALSALSLDAALAQSGVTPPEASIVPEGGGPSALPPIVPGTRMLVLDYADFHAMDYSAGSTMVYSGGVYQSAGFLAAPLAIEPGSRIARIDVYGAKAGSGVVTFALHRTKPDAAQATTVTAIPVSGSPILSGAYAPATPLAVAAGERLSLRAAGGPTGLALGAIVQYFDAKPQLNLLNAPVRVYDSRSGFTPNGVTKGQLANAATRAVDCKLLSAVPAGAAAALVNLTVTNTSSAGFLGLYRNGINWPGNSSINWDHTGTSIAATTVTALDANAFCRAYVSSGSSTDFLIDVIGFYA